MEPIITNLISHLELGEIQIYKNMAVIPLLYPKDDSPRYISLQEALDSGQLTVKELADGEHVSELTAVIQGNIAVLILDGEELMGAKQNRILNASILLKEKSETTIPVSCTEHGRWRYVSREFRNSGYISSREVRFKKTKSVSQNLHSFASYQSDQAEVWDEISTLHEKLKVSSSTGAERDVYEAKKKDLEEYSKAFELIPNQKGLLVFIHGEVVGLDMLSLESAYPHYHDKFIKSYCLDALWQKSTENIQPDMVKAKSFLENISKCHESKYKSIGFGWDYRFKGKSIVGSSLLHQKTAIHTTFFQLK